MRNPGLTFKVTVPHNPKMDRHEWFFPNGFLGVGPIEQRDRAGRARGKRGGYFPDWFALMCNYPGCDGRAVVPVSFLTDHANSQDPEAAS